MVLHGEIVAKMRKHEFAPPPLPGALMGPLRTQFRGSGSADGRRVAPTMPTPSRKPSHISRRCRRTIFCRRRRRQHLRPSGKLRRRADQRARAAPAEVRAARVLLEEPGPHTEAVGDGARQLPGVFHYMLAHAGCATGDPAGSAAGAAIGGGQEASWPLLAAHLGHHPHRSLSLACRSEPPETPRPHGTPPQSASSRPVLFGLR